MKKLISFLFVLMFALTMFIACDDAEDDEDANVSNFTYDYFMFYEQFGPAGEKQTNGKILTAWMDPANTDSSNNPYNGTTEISKVETGSDLSDKKKKTVTTFDSNGLKTKEVIYTTYDSGQGEWTGSGTTVFDGTVSGTTVTAKIYDEDSGLEDGEDVYEYDSSYRLVKLTEKDADGTVLSTHEISWVGTSRRPDTYKYTLASNDRVIEYKYNYNGLEVPETIKIKGTYLADPTSDLVDYRDITYSYEEGDQSKIVKKVAKNYVGASNFFGDYGEATYEYEYDEGNVTKRTRTVSGENDKVEEYVWNTGDLIQKITKKEGNTTSSNEVRDYEDGRLGQVEHQSSTGSTESYDDYYYE